MSRQNKSFFFRLSSSCVFFLRYLLEILLTQIKNVQKESQNKM
jgi:hypothetical protein